MFSRPALGESDLADVANFLLQCNREVRWNALGCENAVRQRSIAPQLDYLAFSVGNESI